MSHAVNAGLFGGFGVFQVVSGLEGVLSHTLETQTLVDAYMAKASSVDAGTVNDAYQFANNSLSNAYVPVAWLVVGSLCLGVAAYSLAKSYERKE